MNDEELLKNLIVLGESAQLEFRNEVRNDEAAKIICSFLDAKG